MSQTPKRLEPRWHATVAIFAVGGLRLALPRELAVGPDWLFLIVVGVLAVLCLLAAQIDRHKLATFLGYLVLVVVTADMTWSLCLLVAALPQHKETPLALLRSAGELLDHQHHRLRIVVLAAGRRRPIRPQPAR